MQRHVVDQLGPVQYLHDVRFLCAAVFPATADRKREIGVGIRQVAEVGVEIGLLELRIVAAFADLLAQRVACFELRCAFFSCFVEAVLDVGVALGPVATIDFVDADADTDPVVIGRLVGASARYRQRGSRAELTLCEELVDGGRGSRSEGCGHKCRQQEIHGTHAILLRRTSRGTDWTSQLAGILRCGADRVTCVTRLAGASSPPPMSSAGAYLFDVVRSPRGKARADGGLAPLKPQSSFVSFVHRSMRVSTTKFADAPRRCCSVASARSARKAAISRWSQNCTAACRIRPPLTLNNYCVSSLTAIGQAARWSARGRCTTLWQAASR